MKTWDEFKEQAKKDNPDIKGDIEEMENLAEIIGQIITKRNELGISQRELAALCGIPQSSVARIESFQTTPNLNTVIKVLKPLGLKLIVANN